MVTPEAVAGFRFYFLAIVTFCWFMRPTDFMRSGVGARVRMIKTPFFQIAEFLLLKDTGQ
jgi:uncharacterized membrane protein